MTERVVLAYSGGLDTSVAIGWIAEQTGAEVIARRRRRRPGRRGPGDDQAARPGVRRGRGCRGRRPRRVRRRLLHARPASQRAVHGPVPAGLGAVAAGDRQAPGARRARDGRDLVAHGCTGKGNDQVRFEVGIAALAPDVQVLRAGPRLGHDPRQGDRVRGREGPADRRHQEVAVLDRPERLGPQRSRPGSWRTSGMRRIDDIYAYTATRRPAARAGRGRHQLRRRAAGRASTASRCQPLAIITELNTAGRARTASAGSTWSRTGWSASRAARSTRRPARSP